MRKLGCYFSFLTAFLATPAFAYIGPGLGAGTIAVVLGVIGSIFLAFVAIVWYPAKRLFRRLKAPVKESEKRNHILDERDSDKYSSPLGNLDAWNTPTVLLGSAGHLIAGPWYVVGGAG